VRLSVFECKFSIVLYCIALYCIAIARKNTKVLSRCGLISDLGPCTEVHV